MSTERIIQPSKKSPRLTRRRGAIVPLIAVIPGVGAATLQQTALDVMAAIGTSGTIVDVDPPTIEDSTEQITVTVRVPLADNAWIIPQFF